MLIHGFGWTSTEVAEMTGIKPSTVEPISNAAWRDRADLKVEGKEHA